MRGCLVVAQQARDEDGDAVRAAYKALGVSADIRPFFDNMPERRVRAQLVICRSGASSVADVAAVGRPAILIPYAAAARDHQTANAEAMVATGGAIRVPDDELDADRLAAELEPLLSDPERRRRMSDGIRSASRLDAAAAVADLVEAEAGPERR